MDTPGLGTARSTHRLALRQRNIGHGYTQMRRIGTDWVQQGVRYSWQGERAQLRSNLPL